MPVIGALIVEAIYVVLKVHKDQRSNHYQSELIKSSSIRGKEIFPIIYKIHSMHVKISTPYFDGAPLYSSKVWGYPIS